MGELLGRIVYDPTYGTGMQQPPRVTITPNSEVYYHVAECVECAVLRAENKRLREALNNIGVAVSLDAEIPAERAAALCKLIDCYRANPDQMTLGGE